LYKFVETVSNEVKKSAFDMPYSIIYVDSGTEFNSTDRFSYISGRKLCGTPKKSFSYGVGLPNGK
jgi:hypothetical protein